jgi:hypothetical protein
LAARRLDRALCSFEEIEGDDAREFTLSLPKAGVA